MKKTAKIIALFCFCLMFWGSYDAPCQTVSAPDELNLIGTGFYCYAYDGGAVFNVSAKNVISTPLTPCKDCKTNRSSMEDIWKENEEYKETTKIVSELPVDLFAKQ